MLATGSATHHAVHKATQEATAPVRAGARPPAAAVFWLLVIVITRAVPRLPSALRHRPAVASARTAILHVACPAKTVTERPLRGQVRPDPALPWRWGSCAGLALVGGCGVTWQCVRGCGYVREAFPDGFRDGEAALPPRLLCCKNGLWLYGSEAQCECRIIRFWADQGRWFLWPEVRIVGSSCMVTVASWVVCGLAEVQCMGEWC